jgi:hypothetical protein
LATDQLYATLLVTPIDAAKIRAAAQKLFDADVALSTGFLAFEKKVPANVQAHVEAARAVLSKEIADLQNVIVSTDNATLTSALVTFNQDAQAEGPTFVLLRSDIGLPPAGLGSPSPTPSA